MPVRLPSTTRNKLPTDSLERALPGPPSVRDDAQDPSVAILPTDRQPPGLEPLLGVQLGKDEPREWPQGELRVRPTAYPTRDSPAGFMEAAP